MAAFASAGPRTAALRQTQLSAQGLVEAWQVHQYEKASLPGPGVPGELPTSHVLFHGEAQAVLSVWNNGGRTMSELTLLCPDISPCVLRFLSCGSELEMSAQQTMAVAPWSLSSPSQYQARQSAPTLVWQPASLATGCGVLQCPDEPRHNCRHCGIQFCNFHCSDSFPVPAGRSREIRGKDIAATISDGFARWANSRYVRVCGPCHAVLREKHAYPRETEVLLPDVPEDKDVVAGAKSTPLMSLADLFDLQSSRASAVGQVTAHFAWRSFCHLRYALPSHTYTAWERLMLWTHRDHFAGHTRWVIRFIRSLRACDLDLPEVRRAVEDLLRSVALPFCEPDEKTHAIRTPSAAPCDRNQLLGGCSRGCSRYLTPFDAAELLSLRMLDDVDVQPLLLTVFRQTDTNMLCSLSSLFAPCLIALVNQGKTATADTLMDFIVSQRALTQDPDDHLASRLLVQIYSAIAFKVYNTPTTPLSTWYESKLLVVLHDRRDRLDKVRNFCNMLSFIPNHRVCKDDDDYLKRCKQSLEDRLASSQASARATFPMPLPWDFDGYAITSLRTDNIRVLQSKTKPILLTCVEEVLKPARRFFYKQGDDVRRDQAVQAIVGVMESILASAFVARNADARFGRPELVRYGVYISGQDSGFIECVPSCETLYDIYHGNRSNEPLENLSTYCFAAHYEAFAWNLALSLGEWLVITHLLAVGDRHYENAMITRDGRLFHIDYGYLMGDNDHKLFDTTALMIDEHLAKFLTRANLYTAMVDHACWAFNELRRYASLFLSLISVCEYDLHSRHVLLVSRFLPGYTDRESGQIFRQTLEANTNYTNANYMRKRTLPRAANRAASAASATASATRSAFAQTVSSVSSLLGDGSL